MNQTSATFVPRILQNDPELKELDLSNKHVDDLTCAQVSDALKINRFIQRLDLSGNPLNDDSALFLAEMLLENQSLRELSIAGTRMTDSGGDALAKALETNPRLLSLKCDGLFGDEVCGRIEYWTELNHHPPDLKKYLPAVERNDDRVTILDLSSRETDAKAYDEVSVRKVAAAMATNTWVKRLVLDRNFGNDDKLVPIIEALEQNQTVDSLSLASDHVGPRGARALAKLLETSKTITEINLTDNEIGDAGARALLGALENNCVCRSIPLSDNDISGVLLQKMDAALTMNSQPDELKTLLPRVLANDLYLEKLDLRGASTNTAGPKRAEDLKAYYNNLTTFLLSDALRINTCVRTVDLTDNFVGPEGAKCLAALLKINQFITDVNLKDNFVADEGARALVDALAYNDSVITMDLHGNGVSSKVLAELRAKLLLNQIPSKLKKILPALKNNDPELTELSFCDLDKAPKPLFEKKMHVLEDSCAEFLFQGLRLNTVVSKLDLSYQNFSDDGVHRLAEMLRQNHTIRRLNLCHNPQITDKGADTLIEMLRSNDVLQQVDLGGCRLVTHKKQEQLEQAVRMNLQPTALKHVLPRIINNDQSCRRIAFAPPPEGEDEGQHMDRRKKKVKGDMDDQSCPILANALLKNTWVTHLDLSRQKISSFGVQHLMEYLQTSTSLLHLDLSDNEIAAEGAKFLATALKENKVLRHLNLSGNPLSESGGKHIDALMRVNATIKSLDLDNCGLSTRLATNVENIAKLNKQPCEVKVALVRALEDDPGVTLLDFSNINSTNSFGVPKEDAIAREMTDDCVVPAAYCLLQNKHVNTVDFSNGTVSSAACEAVAGLLKRNTTIHTVRMANNRIGDDGVQPLMEALRTNSTVTAFDMSGNPLSEGVARNLRMAVALNAQPRAAKSAAWRVQKGDRSLKSFRLCDYDGARYCDDTTCEVLEHYLREHKHPVRDLDLSDNMITDEGVPFLVKIMASNPDMLKLKLNNNQITNQGATLLLKALLDTKLQCLELKDNDISDEILMGQIERKVADHAKRADVIPKPNIPRRSSPVMNISKNLDMMKKAEDSILNDALAERTTILVRTW